MYFRGAVLTVLLIFSVLPAKPALASSWEGRQYVMLGAGVAQLSVIAVFVVSSMFQEKAPDRKKAYFQKKDLALQDFTLIQDKYRDSILPRE